MRWQYVLHIIGAFVACVGLTMVFPMFWSIYYDDGMAQPLASAMGVGVFLGGGAFFAFRDRKTAKTAMSHREGMAIVALGWFSVGFFGGLPFYFGGVFESVVDCVFESLSGFSTTGASVLIDIEAVPRSILFWRSLTHWLGGMGIIVLSLAILPFLGVGGMQLYRAEAPGPTPDKLKPRIKDTAMTLWKVYVLFSAALTVLLLFGGMDLFDALCHSFGTMATGGFSIMNASVAAYDSAYIDYVITAFMLIAGVNFALHYLLIKGRPGPLLRDPEFRVFAVMFAVFTVIIAVTVYASADFENAADAFRYTSFQVASILTTTGYATADYEAWPGLAQVILVICMFVGGCAGSTSGGMKVMRVMVLTKYSYRELFRLIHPRSVSRIKMGTATVGDDVISGVWGFFILWLGLMVLGALVVAASGVDAVTSFSAALACIGNIGPGIGGVGPTDNYAWLPDTAKRALSFCMVLGRLEIYTVIVLFVPEFWRK